MASTLKARPSARPGPGTSLDSGTPARHLRVICRVAGLDASYTNAGPPVHDQALDTSRTDRPSVRAVFLTLLAFGAPVGAQWPLPPPPPPPPPPWVLAKVDPLLLEQLSERAGQSYVIVRAQNAGVVGIVSAADHHARRDAGPQPADSHRARRPAPERRGADCWRPVRSSSASPWIASCSDSTSAPAPRSAPMSCGSNSDMTAPGSASP